MFLPKIKMDFGKQFKTKNDHNKKTMNVEKGYGHAQFFPCHLDIWVFLYLWLLEYPYWHYVKPFPMVKREEFGFKFSAFSALKEVPEPLQSLALKAKEAVKSSYSPYSHFAVGAAVLLANGVVVMGSNQENGAYPSGLCAERVALFYAGAAFPGIAVKAIAIAAQYEGKPTDEPVSPCGGCRQVMMETRRMGGAPIQLLMVGEEKIVLVEDVAFLLPLAFSNIDDALKGI